MNDLPGLNFQLEEGQVPQIAIFLSLYFALTGLHALHMVIGIGLLAVLAVMALRGRFGPSYFTPVELTPGIRSLQVQFDPVDHSPEQVVELLAPPRRLDHSPLFQVMLAWQEGEGGGGRLSGQRRPA